MAQSLLNDLNEKQQEAVAHTDGPILIMAGAGSGKTRVLTYRVAYLISEKHVSPHEILMVTFTNKAAQEMKDRIRHLLGATSDMPFAGTFHALCVRILRRDGKTIGISPDFLIYDEQDQHDAIKDIMKKLDLSVKNYNPSAVLHTISEAKNELIPATEYPQYARGYFQEAVAQIYLAYQKLLRENEALDFDDLLAEQSNYFKKIKKYSDTTRKNTTMSSSTNIRIRIKHNIY